MGIGIANLLLNLLVVALLMATITYCWLLNRRIRILQDSKSELSQLLQYFDESTTRASESIIALQSASKKIGENIQTRIDKANYVMDDLAFMVEKGNRLANQLEASFAVSRARSRVIAEAPLSETDTLELPKASASAPIKPAPVMERFVPPKASEKLSTREKTAASLEAVLDRVIGRGGKSAANEDEAPARKSGVNTKARSKAEQELLEMIRAGIKG